MASWRFHQQRNLTWNAGLGRFHRAEHGFILRSHSLCQLTIISAHVPPLKLRQTQMQTTQVAGEFLMLKHLASNGKADPDAHLKRIKAGRLLAAQLAED